MYMYLVYIEMRAVVIQVGEPRDFLIPKLIFPSLYIHLFTEAHMHVHVEVHVHACSVIVLIYVKMPVSPSIPD